MLILTSDFTNASWLPPSSWHFRTGYRVRNFSAGKPGGLLLAGVGRRKSSTPRMHRREQNQSKQTRSTREGPGRRNNRHRRTPRTHSPTDRASHKLASHLSVGVGFQIVVVNKKQIVCVSRPPISCLKIKERQIWVAIRRAGHDSTGRPVAPEGPWVVRTTRGRAAHIIGGLIKVLIDQRKIFSCKKACG